MDSARRLVLACLGLNIKYCTSPGLNSTRWLGLFSNKTFRKHLKLIFPHSDFIIYIVSLAIFHPHSVIRLFPSAFYHPHISIRILSSAIFHLHFSIRRPPPSGPHFTETPFFLVVRLVCLRNFVIESGSAPSTNDLEKIFATND